MLAAGGGEPMAPHPHADTLCTPRRGGWGGTTGAQRALLWLLILAPQGESGVSSVAETPNEWGGECLADIPLLIYALDVDLLGG